MAGRANKTKSPGEGGGGGEKENSQYSGGAMPKRLERIEKTKNLGGGKRRVLSGRPGHKKPEKSFGQI